MTMISGLLFVPIALNFMLSAQSDNTQFHFLTEILLLLFMHRLTRKAISATSKISTDASVIGSFMNQLRSATHEVDSTIMKNPQADLHLSATASPSKGISVSDLWAAHVTKRYVIITYLSCVFFYVLSTLL